MHKISTFQLALTAYSQLVTCRSSVVWLVKLTFLILKDRLSHLSVICMEIPQNPLVPLSTCSDINSLIKPKMNKRKQASNKVPIVSSNEPQNKLEGK